MLNFSDSIFYSIKIVLYFARSSIVPAINGTCHDREVLTLNMTESSALLLTEITYAKQSSAELNVKIAEDIISNESTLDFKFEEHKQDVRTISSVSTPTPRPCSPPVLSEPLLATEREIEISSAERHIGTQDAETERLLTYPEFGSIAFLSAWFPSVDPERSTWRTRRSRRKVVIWTCFATTVSIFLLNLTMTLISWLRYEVSPDGVVTLYTGDCTVSKRLDAGLHLLINILSTLLLSASNLCLQLMVAPTRMEINRAHSQNRWLDIGVPSWRNMRNLSVPSIIIWLAMALSSIPIHFLYNATVFSTVSTNSYVYSTVTEPFLFPSGSVQTFQLTNGTRVAAPSNVQEALEATVRDRSNPFGHYGIPTKATTQTMVHIHEDVQANLQSYQNLSNIDCLNNYFSPFQWRPHIILVSKDYETALSHNTSLLTWGSNAPSATNRGSLNPISWTNDPANDWQDVTTINSSTMAEWSLVGNRVQYCLRKIDTPGEKAFKDCRVQCAPQILLITTVFNAVKCVGILWVLFGRPEKTLSTLGDAIASFLEDPDPYTKDLTGLSMEIPFKDQTPWRKRKMRRQPPRGKSWYQAASPRRWYFTMITSFIVLLLGIIVLGTGLAVVKKYEHSIGFSTLWSLGFGVTNYKEIISWGQPTSGKWGLFMNIVIANIWQVLVSLCYIAQNALLSCLLVAEEWTGFASHRKTLRVSHPQGIQRSTYFVSMPLRYGIPTMILFSLEHWLLSQTSFIIRVISLDLRESPPAESQGWTTSGFSIIPAIFALVLPTVLIIAQIANAFIRKYPADSTIPLVSTCSIAISANCHRPEADSEAHLSPVQWGVIGEDDSGNQHCSLTTLRGVCAPL